MSNNTVMRSYKHMIPANKGKSDWLRSGIFMDYATAANTLAIDLDAQWLRFFKSQDKNDRPMRLLPKVQPDLKLMVTTTVAQQAYANSVYPALVSKVGNVVNDIRSDINYLSAGDNPPDADSLKQLFYINKSRKWLRQEGLTSEQAAWLEERFWLRWNKRSVPKFQDNIIYIDQRNCKVQQAKASREFEKWLRITHRGSGVTLPVKSNRYADQHNGKTKGMYRILFNQHKHRLEADFVKSIDYGDSIDTYTQLCDSLDSTIALDFGLRSVFVSHRGNRYGFDLIDYMTKLDKRIHHIQAQCQKRKFRLSRSVRYRELVHRLRVTIDRVVNEALNAVVNAEHPSMIIVEKLDFNHPNLSKREMVRLNPYFKKHLNAEVDTESCKVEIQYQTCVSTLKCK